MIDDPYRNANAIANPLVGLLLLTHRARREQLHWILAKKKK